MDIYSLRTYAPETNTYKYQLPTELPRRPQPGNTAGKEVTIRVNSYNIVKYPDKTIYQYDVSGPCTPFLPSNRFQPHFDVLRSWLTLYYNRSTLAMAPRSARSSGRSGSRVLSNKPLVQDGSLTGTVLPGELLARPSTPVVDKSLILCRATADKQREFTVVVDLDEEQGRTARAGRENKHKVTIRQTTKVPLTAIDAYLKGKISFDNSVLEAISQYLVGVPRCFRLTVL